MRSRPVLVDTIDRYGMPGMGGIAGIPGMGGIAGAAPGIAGIPIGAAAGAAITGAG